MATVTGGTVDEHMRFSSAQEILSSAISSNIIDLRATFEHGITARPLYIVSVVTTAFTDSGNNSNATLILQTDGVEAFNSATNTQTLGVFATNAAVGDIICVPIGPLNAGERYLGVYYDIGGGNLTTGKVTTWITDQPTLWDPAPKGYTGPTTA